MKSTYKQIFDLKSKSAIVTGATGFLGHRFCEALAAFGANVAVVDVKAHATKRIAIKLRKKYGVKTAGIPCDVSDPASVARMVRETVRQLGPVTILLNNAATKTADPALYYTDTEKYSLKVWRQVMSVNIDGMFLVAQAVGNQMVKQRKGGSIIQTSSIYGILAPDQRIYEGSKFLGLRINSPAVYSASKSGVIGLTKYLATYWADKKIRVNTLTPGGIEGGQNSVFKKRYSARVPLGRMGRADELAGALIFLSSNASAYMTGQNLIVDGGLSAW